MKLNWKVRFKNKVFLSCFIAEVVSFIYTILGMLEVYPVITQNQVMQIVNLALMVLGATGIIVDPTTDGVGDSERALGYDEPWVDTKE